MKPFRDRIEAGQQLAAALAAFADRPAVIVLGLPRGGVPVAFEVAQQLHAALDVIIVRKLGLPGQEELAMGAIASGGVRVVNESMGLPASLIEQVARREQIELQRREASYRGDRPFPDLRGRLVILVDDGLATGASMRAAVQAVRQHGADHVVVAVPVAPPDTVRQLQRQADEVVCLEIPSTFSGVGGFYDQFSQTSDQTVRELLQKSWQREGRLSEEDHVRPPGSGQGSADDG
jgi:predicted phosphoribosyltransferase